MQTPPTKVRPGPQKKATRVVMPSGRWSGAGDMACADVATAKAKAAPANNLIISVLPCLASKANRDFAWSAYVDLNQPRVAPTRLTRLRHRAGPIISVETGGSPREKLWELHKCVVEFHLRCAQFSHFSASLKKKHRKGAERLFLLVISVDTGNRQREHCHGDALRSARRASER
jgi:hypothetical protein